MLSNHFCRRCSEDPNFSMVQEFLDDGHGNLKGIKMVNVRWEKIDGQMRILSAFFVSGQGKPTLFAFRLNHLCLPKPHCSWWIWHRLPFVDCVFQFLGFLAIFLQLRHFPPVSLAKVM